VHEIFKAYDMVYNFKKRYESAIRALHINMRLFFNLKNGFEVTLIQWLDNLRQIKQFENATYTMENSKRHKLETTIYDEMLKFDFSICICQY
jgi:hypothetical protein